MMLLSILVQQARKFLEKSGRVEEKKGTSSFYAVQAIPDKTFGTKWNNPVKFDRNREFWYLFWVFLNCYSQSLSF